MTMPSFFATKSSESESPVKAGEKTNAEDTSKMEKKADESTESKDAAKEDSANKTPPGMLAEMKNLYQKKDSDGKYQWVAEYPDEVVEAAENSETAKFAFLVRNKKSYDSRKTLDIDSIIVQSPLLKEALGLVLQDYPGVTVNLKRLVSDPKVQDKLSKMR